MERERIVLGGGSRSWKVIASPSILRSLPGVEVVEGLANEPPPSGMTGPGSRIRPVEDDDLPIFLAHQDDPVAAAMAAFPTRAPGRLLTRTGRRSGPTRRTTRARSSRTTRSSATSSAGGTTADARSATGSAGSTGEGVRDGGAPR